MRYILLYLLIYCHIMYMCSCMHLYWDIHMIFTAISCFCVLTFISFKFVCAFHMPWKKHAHYMKCSCNQFFSLVFIPNGIFHPACSCFIPERKKALSTVASFSWKSHFANCYTTEQRDWYQSTNSLHNIDYNKHYIFITPVAILMDSRVQIVLYNLRTSVSAL